jgi:hypothetical protein
MECHSKTISRQLATSPHNVPSERLLGIRSTRRSEENGALATAEKAAFAVDHQLACSTCHREHHGSQYDLTAMTNDACQACHIQRYESFATDHPEFDEWPYGRRTRIVFNHASHATKHFAEKKQKFECAACHVEDATRAVQLSLDYETACSACHDEKIATSVAQGAAMLILPTLDVEALEDAGHVVPGWPAGATGDFDGRLPPVMKLLLSADPAAAEAMRALGEDFEFLDIDPDNSQHLAACATLARAIQRLFADLGASGGGAVRNRLTQALAREVTEKEIKALVAGLSQDTLRGAAETWLPSAGAGQAHDRSNTEVTVDTTLAYAPAGAWVRDDTVFAIRYRPAAHADPVLTGWLDALVKTKNLDQQPVALAAFKELSSQTAPGLCITCHSVEQSASGQLSINWRGYDRTHEPRGFTKFSHGPHLLLPQLADCAKCHVIDQRSTAAATHSGWNPQQFASEFLPMSKGQCAQCHTATAAGDRCQSCHNYHVESAGFRVERSDVPELTAEPRIPNPEP